MKPARNDQSPPRSKRSPGRSLPESADSGPTFEQERLLHAQNLFPIAGVDEVGRGCLAGPVVAAACVLPDGFQDPGLNDSKKLTAAQREKIFALLSTAPSVIFGIGLCSVEEIDQLNILRASHEAMRRAVIALKVAPAHLLVDGLPVPGLPIPHTALVKGDSRSLSIAAASIIAKVTRDKLLMELDLEHPEYGFAKHKGYGTRTHLEAIRQHGITPHHRRSFAPVRQMDFDF